MSSTQEHWRQHRDVGTTRLYRTRHTQPSCALRVHRIPAPRPDDRERPLCPENLSECANGRLSQNRPSLEL